MDLSIITVTYNARDYILRQISSVRQAAAGLTYEHFIVDNGSTDGTADLVARNFPEVKIIRNPDNRGFGHANNQAAALARGEYLLFLNPDMELESDSLARFLAWARSRPRAGASGCRLVNQAGETNLAAAPRRFPRISDQLFILFKLPHFFPGLLSGYLYRGRDWTREQSVDTVRGSFLLLKREIYDKLGWVFDPRYFIWFEDVDLCREVKKMGYEVVYTPVITAVDLVGRAFKKRDVLWKQRQFTRSMVQYFRKWEPWYKWLWPFLARPMALFIARLSSVGVDKKDYL